MNHSKTTTLFVLALALPGSAWSRPAAQEACDSLQVLATQVLGDAKALRCQAQGETLNVEGPDAAFQQARAAVFPKDLYQEFRVVRGKAAQVSSLPARAAAERYPAPGETLKGLTAAVNFDGSSARGGLLMSAGGPRIAAAGIGLE